MLSFQCVSTFHRLLLNFLPCFTAPSGESFLALATAWALAVGPRTVTNLVRTIGRRGAKSHDAYQYFFSGAAWTMDEVWRILFNLILGSGLIARDAVIELAGDDTLVHHTGRRIFGAGIFRDAVRSTKKQVAYAFGHNWVILCLIVQVPFCLVILSLVKLWYLTLGHRSDTLLAWRDAWYRHKDGVAFTDMLAALRFASWRLWFSRVRHDLPRLRFRRAVAVAVVALAFDLPPRLFDQPVERELARDLERLGDFPKATIREPAHRADAVVDLRLVFLTTRDAEHDLDELSSIACRLADLRRQRRSLRTPAGWVA